jgi:hypothetical protein
MKHHARERHVTVTTASDPSKLLKVSLTELFFASSTQLLLLMLLVKT